MTNGFTQSKTLQDIFVGIAISLALTLTVQQVFHRPSEPIVIEKQVIVKVPVYLNTQDKKQIKCLADNAYFEAGNQTTRGKIAVTNVVMNRTGDDSFPSTPCGVVKQKKQGRCQFSWVCERKKPVDSVVYKESKHVAEQVYLQNIGDVTAGATFYHASWMKTYPYWSNVFDRTTKIGDHIFYRES